jgi:hypothetical protein
VRFTLLPVFSNRAKAAATVRGICNRRAVRAAGLELERHADRTDVL